jgi:catecholate siderophore receptor
MKNRTFPNAHLGNRRAKRRRGTARLFVLGASAAIVASSAVTGQAAPVTPTAPPAAAAAAQAPSPVSAPSGQTMLFDIPPDSLGTTMSVFESITGVKVDFANEGLRDLQSAGVSGPFTTQEALERLLTDTNVGFAFTAPDTVRLEVRTSETVTVGGGSPTVSSPRYTVPLRDIAQTIVLVPRQAIEEQGATTLSEALRNVPGITLQAGEGGGASNTAGDMFNMRGFNASNSLFVDNVRDDGLISRDVFNLEQVEVYMGPTGSDVGRGSAAGYVNMQTKAPHAESNHAVLFSYGSARHARLATDFNWAVPAGPDAGWLWHAAFRLNALWQDRGIPGRDLVTQNSKAIAPSVALGLGTPTRVVGSAQIVRQDNLPDYGIPSAAWPGSAFAPTVVKSASPVRQSNYYGRPEYDYDRADQDTVMGRVEHDMSRTLTLRHQARYNRTHRDAVISTVQNLAAFNPATGQVVIARQGNERENAIVSNQTSLANRFATGRLRHGLSAGVEHAFEEQLAPGRTGMGTRQPISVFSPAHDDPVTGYAPARTLAVGGGSTHTIAVYGFDTVELNERWQMSGGVRWEHYRTRFRSVDALGTVTTDLSDAESLVSGKAGVLFRVTPAGNVYFSYGTSVAPPGSANFALNAQPNNQNNPNVKPQESANVEAGTKWELAGGRLSLTGSLFRTENENVIFTVDATAVPPLFNQDDGQLVRGAVVGALGRLTDRWEVLANAAYLDSEQRSQNPVNNGRRLTLTPELSASVWSTYRLAGGLSLGGGLRHVGSAYVNAANTIRVPGHWVADAVVEYPVNSHLSLRANVYNVTDESYVRSVNNNGARYLPGYSRSALVTLSLRP